jgi:hypothetical protein
MTTRKHLKRRVRTRAALIGSADRIEAELTGWITRLRERGTDWPTIAAAAGLDVEVARRRFGPLVP